MQLVHPPGDTLPAGQMLQPICAPFGPCFELHTLHCLIVVAPAFCVVEPAGQAVLFVRTGKRLQSGQHGSSLRGISQTYQMPPWLPE